MLIIRFALYQAVYVPGQKPEVEFDHNQRVEADMVELGNTFSEASPPAKTAPRASNSR